ncbi:hypothetical protein NGB36_08045 [Streptomyces sp. RB6PN25]|uniref:C2H2-type domain-containing protein n=1 Tax=Streptomyces humicola TaxID=2953240 RepID=A0ABT1PSA5_9ACTN|nr:hypothetical protein [Streptomyces humicola]MCQ4080554.1 hypothetical protein [Streptomyces humicola]
MSETVGTPYPHGSSNETVHEAYSFACMGCGHVWEQSYEIGHHTDEAGHTSVTYYVHQQPVPSPLTRPTCMNCGGHHVRIMRSGRVSGAVREHPMGSAMSEQGGTTGSWADPFNVLGGLAWDTGWEHEGEEREEREEKAAEDEAERPRTRRPHRNWVAVLLALFRRDRDQGRPA